MDRNWQKWFMALKIQSLFLFQVISFFNWKLFSLYFTYLLIIYSLSQNLGGTDIHNKIYIRESNSLLTIKSQFTIPIYGDGSHHDVSFEYEPIVANNWILILEEKKK